MKKVTIIFLATATLFMICFSIAIVQNVKANFVPLPQEPPTENPKITFTFPIQNQSILTKNELNLTFRVIVPSSWNNYLAPYYSPINESIQNVTIFTSWDAQVNLNITESNNYSLHLQNIPKGNNTITVAANAVVLYRLPTTGAFQQDEIKFNISSNINFVVEDSELLLPISLVEPDNNIPTLVYPVSDLTLWTMLLRIISPLPK